MGLEIPSTLQFDVGPEYQSMVSQVLDPRRSELNSRHPKSLRPSDQVHVQLQNNPCRERYPSGEYYEMPMGEMNPESEYGQPGFFDVRELYRPYARDADHLAQMLIEYKMGRFEMMDKISEEHSMDMDHSIISQAVNKSAIFKDPKLIHSASFWINGPQTGLTPEGRHLLNTSFGSKRDISRNLLNNSNNFSRELNRSFKLMASQGELGSSRLDDSDLRGLFLRNSSFKHKKFPPKRKISLKVDGKKFQESQFFHIPESKNNNCAIYSPNKREMITRMKSIRNSDVTEKRKQAKELQQSRSLNNSGIHSIGKSKPTNFVEFELRSYSVSKEDHNSVNVIPFQLDAKSGGDERIEEDKAEHVNEENEPRAEEPPKGGDTCERRTERDKRCSLGFLDEPDFEYSCVELNESKENNLDTESIRNIVDPCLMPMKDDSIIMYNGQRKQRKTAEMQSALFELKNAKAMDGFKKIKFGEGGFNQTQRTFTGTNESWMKYPSQLSQMGDKIRFPRKISEIPVVDSSHKNSVIIYGGEMTPYHKRSEIIETNFLKSHATEKHKSGEQEQPEDSKQNINDLVKLIIQKTENVGQEPKKEKIKEKPEKEDNHQKTLQEDEEPKRHSRQDPGDPAELKETEFSDQFDSCITNMPSTVNIESTANLQTIFDINYNPQEQQIGQIKLSEERRKKMMQGSMLTDEQPHPREVFRVVSTSDNDLDSEDQIDSFLLIPNAELARKNKRGSKNEQLEMQPQKILESAMSNLKNEQELVWARVPQLSGVKGQFFKKAMSKEMFQEIQNAKSATIKQKYRSSKLGLKITRMSRKAGRHEVFKMRSPTTLSITNHAELSDPRKPPSKTQLKRPLKNAKYRRLREKLWESVVSSKNQESAEGGSKFDRTLGSVSIQSLLKKSSEIPLSLIKRRKSKAKRALRKTDDKFSWKGNKPRYQSGQLKHNRTGDLNMSQDPVALLSLKAEDAETHSTSRMMKNSAHGSSSIYSKRSQQEVILKQMRRSNTLQHQSQKLAQKDVEVLQMPQDQMSEAPLISEDLSQREIDADLLRLRNQKEIESNFQNIYKPRAESHDQIPQTDNFSRRSGQSGSASQPFRKEETRRWRKNQTKGSQTNTGKGTHSNGLDSHGRGSDTSSLFHHHRNSGNESGFLPFPRSIKMREEKNNQSKLSEMRDTATPGVKEYFSGNIMGLNLNQREEYGILSGKSANGRKQAAHVIQSNTDEVVLEQVRPEGHRQRVPPKFHA